MRFLRRHIWFTYTALGLVVFLILALLLLIKSSPMIRLDAHLAEACFDYGIEHPSVKDVFIRITDTGVGDYVWFVGIASVVVLILRREYLFALIWTVGQYTTRYIPELAKDQFERPRPPFTDAKGYSFPSGHAFVSAAIYGMLAYLVLRLWVGSRWRWVLAGLLYVHILLVAISRMILGVHYLSDVMAGMCLGLAWACGCAALAELLAKPKNADKLG